MGIIHPLPPEVVALIAAGEIIERPAYALKELLDNAIDAHATSINITLVDAGISKMIVEDDGIGMSTEDVKESWKLHSTSKLQTTDELHTVKTQGFRGEALASIAASGELTIQSRQATAAYGYEIHIQDQKIVREGKVGMPTGTRISIEHLFATLPARKKFLRSTQTEFRHCMEIVTGYAIAHPNVRFVLKHNGTIVLTLPSTTDARGRLEALFDQKLVEQLLPISLQESYISIKGFIAHPSQTSASATKQYIFVNRRSIKDRLVTQAIHDSLREILPKDKNPIFFIHLHIPFELVNVNVHPRKEIVQFSSPDTVYTAVQSAVVEMMKSNALTFQTSLEGTNTTGRVTDSIAGQFLKQTTDLPVRVLPKKMVCTQIHKTYIVFQTDHGLMIVDQHAAQERTFYEKLKKQFEIEQQKKKVIPMKIALPLTSIEYLTLQEFEKEFNALGFTFAEFSQRGKQKIYITHIPALFEDRDPVPIIEEILTDLQNGLPIRAVDTLTHTMLTYIACRSSVKAGDTLSQKEMKDIVMALQKVEHKYTCPHGRPTMIEVPTADLHRLFLRA